jgi:endonuclease/exonuclease/phosphatase family metal-dependent hydrolase
MPAPMLRVASYNIHKAIGLDRRRDPERVMTVLHEIGADVVALQEADRRFGARESALPPQLIEAAGYVPVPIAQRPHSIGWHGNALLVRRGIGISGAANIVLPTLEPRGAIRADLSVDGHIWRIVAMHLDLSGLRRRHQVRAIMAHLAAADGDPPTVLMGDLNEWSPSGGCLRDFAPMQVLRPGRSFHSRRPVAQLDRIIVSPGVTVSAIGVHRSPLSARASDHLPVWADLSHE